MEIIVDGVRFVPEHSSTPKIGIGITTRNRPEAFEKTYAEICRRSPGAKIVVVDDASSQPVKEATYRFEQNVGIARAKNKCLELLDDCEHIFLFDDDIYPIVDEWWKPYVESPEPHLMWMFDKPIKDRGGSQIVEIFRDSKHVAYHVTRGAMLYVHRSVLDVVGGMDPAFGKWGWEHVSWSDRIHSAGLTTWRYADVVGSDKLMHSMDHHCEVKSTATEDAKKYAETVGSKIRMENRNSARYIEYRELEDVVITTLFTKQPDPQRGRRMKSDVSVLRALARSLGSIKLVVLHDELENPSLGNNVEFVKMETGINPYFQRWQSIYQYLRSNPKVGRVWCVDGTDVEMLRNPFPEMKDGVLYVGSEPSTLRNRWMLKNHPDTALQEFMKANPNLQLLNAGLIGGSRDLVLRFAHAITRFWFDDHIDWIMGWESHRAGIGDMAAFNYVARTQFGDVLSWGTHVNTIFKAEERNDVSWWKHK